MEAEATELQVVKAIQLPFEQLPNLPKPVIPQIDLGIQRVDVLAIQPSLASQRRVGYLLTDRSTQTEQSDILEVKRITHTIETLLQDLAQLRKDLNFAQHVLKADHESRLTERSTELYCRVNEKLSDLEQQSQEKMEIVRRSYRAQLSNAIQKIAGEYKTYYEELLQGKTGRHDSKIKELKEKVSEQEQLLQEQAAMVEQLSIKLKGYEEGGQQETEEVDVPPPPPPGISLEEAEELRATIDRLEGEVTELSADIAAKQDANKKLSRQCEGLSRQLEEERGKVGQLKRDMEAFKRKTKAEQERTARMAENQRAALEKEMKEKMEKTEKEAASRAEAEAQRQRMRDQARFQEELDKRNSIEEQLRSQNQQEQRPTMDGDALERLQRIEQQQKEEIERLRKELDRSNRAWELKLAIMQKNFHALKDECFLRHNLQRQAATLHHATVGYAVSGNTSNRLPRNLKPLAFPCGCVHAIPRGKALEQCSYSHPDHLSAFSWQPKIKSSDSSTDKTHSGFSHDSDTPLSLPPPPSPLLNSGRDTQSPKNVRFDDSRRIPVQPVHSSRTESVYS